MVSSVVVKKTETDSVGTLDIDPRTLPHFHENMFLDQRRLDRPPMVVDSEWVRRNIEIGDPTATFHGGHIRNGFRVEYVDVTWKGKRLRLILNEPLNLDIVQNPSG